MSVNVPCDIWTSKDGKFKTEAELLDATDTEVRLRKANRDEITVLLEKLSDQDRTFVEAWRKQRGKSGNKQPSGKATGDQGKEQKLAPLDIKIIDDELTMQAPVGAKVDVEGAFPTVRSGKRFTMSIQPHSDNDLPDFKEQFTNTPDAITLEKVLLEEKEALAYKVNMKAFKTEVSVYMVVVTVGDKKYTCSDSSFDEMNQKEKLSAKDVELMIRCARTLKAKGTTAKPSERSGN